eukprot:112384-Amphidinium_carterae.1
MSSVAAANEGTAAPKPRSQGSRRGSMRVLKGSMRNPPSHKATELAVQETSMGAHPPTTEQACANATV